MEVKHYGLWSSDCCVFTKANFLFSWAHSLIHFPVSFAIMYGHLTESTMQCGHNDRHHLQAGLITTLHV